MAYDNPRPSSQPVGSTDLAVAKDNLITHDLFVNDTAETYTNRKGVTKKTLAGTEAYAETRITTAIAAAGYQIVGDFSDVTKVQITSANQVYTSQAVTNLEDAVWRYIGALPYTPTGSDPTQSPEDGKWQAVAIGELKSIARSLNVADSAVIYSTDTVTPIPEYIYDASVQVVYSVPSAAIGKTISSVVGSTLNTTEPAAYQMTQPASLNNDNGEIIASQFGLSELIADNALVIQDMHDLIVSRAVANGNDSAVQEIVIDSGVYQCLTGLTLRPWVKFKSKGSVVFDYSGAATTVTAIKLNNEGNTYGDIKNASSNGDVFNGRFSLVGPGVSGTSVGVEFGNSVSGASASNFRDAGLGSIVIQDFSELVRIRGYDTYINNFQNFRWELAGDNILTFPDSAGSNSGERMSFFNGTFAGGDNAVLVNDLGTEIIFINCSFDFCGNSVLDITDLAGFQSISFSCCHFENCCDDFMIRGTTTNRQIAINVSGCTVLPKNNDNTKPLTRTDKLSVPRIPLFIGRMDLSIDGLHFSGYNEFLNTAESGLFMCDDDVTISNAKNIVFNGYSQTVSKSSIKNWNWDFNYSTVGASLEFGGDAGFYCYKRNNGIDSVIVNTNTFDGSAAALQLQSTFSLTESYTVGTTPVALDQKSLIGTNVILRGGTTTGDLTAQITTQYFREHEIVSGTITSLTRSTTTATAVCTNHGLTLGSSIRVSGAVETEWNRVFVVSGITDADTFTFAAPNSYAASPTGTILFETTNTLALVSQGSTRFYDFSTGYADTSDPSYTGDRLYYARYKFPHRESKPVGATHACVTVRFLGIDVGDSVNIGGIYLEQI